MRASGMSFNANGYKCTMIPYPSPALRALPSLGVTVTISITVTMTVSHAHAAVELNCKTLDIVALPLGRLDVDAAEAEIATTESLLRADGGAEGEEGTRCEGVRELHVCRVMMSFVGV